jgi:hypothetical protein
VRKGGQTRQRIGNGQRVFGNLDDHHVVVHQEAELHQGKRVPRLVEVGNRREGGSRGRQTALNFGESTSINPRMASRVGCLHSFVSFESFVVQARPVGTTNHTNSTNEEVMVGWGDPLS